MMKRCSPNLFLAAASVAVFLVLLEIALALFWPHKIVTRSLHEQYHPVFGWVNKPFADGFVYLKPNVRFHRHHNGLGLRSLRDIPYDKTAGVKRVLLVGDSFFWGYGVNDEDVESEILQKMVGPQVEIVNGAVSGYGTDQELLWLLEEGLKYKPDIVILGCFPRNDLEEIAHSVMYGYPKPFFSLENDRLALSNVPVPDTRETRRKAFEEPETAFGKLKTFLRHHTHTYPFITKRLNSLPEVRKFLLSIGLADEFTNTLPGVPMATHPLEQVRPLFEALITEMKAVSSKAGADFLLVFIPEKENTPEASLRYEGIPEEGVENNVKTSLFFAKFAAARKIQLIDLLPVFRHGHRRGEQLHSPLGIDHHWSPAGHRVAAETLRDWLVANGYGMGENPRSDHP